MFRHEVLVKVVVFPNSCVAFWTESMRLMNVSFQLLGGCKSLLTFGFDAAQTRSSFVRVAFEVFLRAKHCFTHLTLKSGKNNVFFDDVLFRILCRAYCTLVNIPGKNLHEFVFHFSLCRDLVGISRGFDINYAICPFLRHSI